MQKISLVIFTFQNFYFSQFFFIIVVPIQSWQDVKYSFENCYYIKMKGKKQKPNNMFQIMIAAMIKNWIAIKTFVTARCN
jgi:hypothetical protein